MSAVFVTAIGTDSGKTHIAAAILRELVAQGRPALALKPLMSGYSPDTLDTSDAGRLLTAMRRPVTQEAVDEICWKSFTDWLAPNVAARRSGVALDYTKLLDFVHARLQAHQGPALVEGAGGVMSPMTDTHTNLDLATDLQRPILLLASNYLGGVSHTLTALEVLAQRDLTVKAIVVTETLPNAWPSEPFLEELSRWTKIPLLGAKFARTPEDDRTVAAELVRRLFN
jgi:dethiobiotin synthetase